MFEMGSEYACGNLITSRKNVPGRKLNGEILLSRNPEIYPFS